MITEIIRKKVQQKWREQTIDGYAKDRGPEVVCHFTYMADTSSVKFVSKYKVFQAWADSSY